MRLLVFVLVGAVASGSVAAAPPAVGGKALPATPRPGRQPTLRHAGRVHGVSFSRDGKLTLTWSDDYTVRLWDTSTAQLIQLIRYPYRQGETVKSAALSPNGTLIATACRDRTARLWNAKTGTLVGSLMFHGQEVNAVAFSPDGKYLVTGSNDQTARIWDVATTQPFGAPLNHPQGVERVAFLPDGQRVLTCCQDGTVRSWQVASNSEVGWLCTEPVWATCVDVSRNGRLLLLGSRNRGGQFWDTANGKPLGMPLTPGRWATDVALSPDGRTFLTAGGLRRDLDVVNTTTQLWETVTLQPIGAPFPRKCAVAFHPGGKIVALGGEDGVVTLWDWRDRVGRARHDSLDALWAHLAGENATRARQAITSLVRMPDQTVPFLQKLTHPAPAVDEKRLRKLIADLENASSTIRDAARAELMKTGPAADPILYEFLEGNPSSELRDQLQALLTGPDSTGALADQRRQLRAVQTLEEIGNAAAQAVLQTLARGPAAVVLTREAKAAFERLARK